MRDFLDVEAIAQVCHEANRAYCQTIGDNSQLPWDEAPDWQRESAVKGVQFLIDTPDAPASAQHESWLAEKVAAGWIYGQVKDAETKTHPCIVPYDELSPMIRAKDVLFQGVARALLSMRDVPVTV